MRRHAVASAVTAAFLVSLAAAPAVATHAKWSGPTQLGEPSTKWDTLNYMFQGANTLPVERVYLNGILVKGIPLPGGPRYELQPADGNVIGPDGFHFVALLGYWRDCNRDGYIGDRNAPSSFGNLAAYPRTGASIDTTTCPLGSPYNPINLATGQPDGLIDEFRWIGPGASCEPTESNCPGYDASEARVCVPPATNPPTACTPGFVLSRATTFTNDRNDITDGNATVWADWSPPGGRHVYSLGLNGPLVIDGKPPGTYSDSDGTLKFVDDTMGRDPSRVVGSGWNEKPNVGECDERKQFMGGPQNGLPTGTCGAWPLYQAKRLANDGDARQNEATNPSPLVTVFETEKDDTNDGNPCDDLVDAPLVVDPPPPIGIFRFGYVSVADVKPTPHPNPLVEGSIAGMYGNYDRAVDYSTTDNNDDGRCGTDDSGMAQMESNEADSEFTHRLPTEHLKFKADLRYRFLEQMGFDFIPADGAGASGTVTNGPGWFGNYVWMPRPPRHGWGATQLAFTTFYADVTVEAITRNAEGATASGALPAKKQDAHVYGVPEFCASVLTGPSRVNPANDWECSRSVWEAKRNADAKLDLFQARRPVLGAAYDLRDVDCYDNTVSDGFAPGVKAGLSDCAEFH